MNRDVLQFAEYRQVIPARYSCLQIVAFTELLILSVAAENAPLTLIRRDSLVNVAKKDLCNRLFIFSMTRKVNRVNTVQ